jgi:threonylcarbamoyladenosine tRNA methylthiotransferase MtaB
VNVYLDTIGCRLNQSEIEAYARQFRIAGHTIVAMPEHADLVIVNTCAVTQSAVVDSRKKIRQAAKAIKKNHAARPDAQIVVTGCWSTLNPQDAEELPAVGQVIPNLRKDKMVSELLQVPPETFEKEFIERQPLPGLRLRTRAFIKVQDGCDNRCTFCVTTIARGFGRSRAISEVILDIQSAIAGGAKEVVLSGVHLGSWGKDFAPPLQIADLIRAILNDSDVTRLRLSSLEPWDLQPASFDLWQDKRLCRHLHLPLQSGCATTLRRMARKTTPQKFSQLVESVRRMVQGVSITTDVIVGFPGETESEFQESLEFVERMRFAGGHVFTYSARTGTAAAQMPGQIPHLIRKERNRQMHFVFERSAAEFQNQFLGKSFDVLWESAAEFGPKGWKMSGLTDNNLRVFAHTPRDFWNEITRVKLLMLTDHGFAGSILVDQTNPLSDR